MTQQNQPPGGWPPQQGTSGQPDSPTQVNYPAQGQPGYQGPPPGPGGYAPPPGTSGYTPPPPTPGGYPNQPSGGYPNQPGGGYPNQPGSGYPQQPGGYTPPPPAPGGYPQQPGYPPPPGGGYPPQGPGNLYQPPPPPPPPENHTTRNVIIGIVVALLLIGILGAVYAATRPQVTLPIVTPAATATPTAASEATKTPKPDKTTAPETAAPPTEAQPTEAPPTEAPPTEAPPTEAPPTDAVPTEALPTEQPPTEAPQGSFIPGTEDQEVIFGEPVLLDDDILPEVGLLTQNVGDVVKTYSIKATFKDGDTTTATATGFIGDHIPGTVRVATLYIDGEPGPNDTLTVGLDSMILEDATTPESEVAKLITFGPPTITPGDFAQIDLEVTNGSESSIDLSVVAGIMRDNVLVGVASGFVTDMGPGQTKTATLYVTGDVAETDTLLLTVDSVTIQDE